jgi:hypothetical protein
VLEVNSYEKNDMSVQRRQIGKRAYIVADRPRCMVIRSLQSPPLRVEPIDRFAKKDLPTDRVGFELAGEVGLERGHRW